MATPVGGAGLANPVTKNVKEAKNAIWDQRNRKASRDNIRILAGPHHFYNDIMLRNPQAHLLKGLELPVYREKDEPIQAMLEADLASVLSARSLGAHGNNDTHDGSNNNPQGDNNYSSQDSLETSSLGVSNNNNGGGATGRTPALRLDNLEDRSKAGGVGKVPCSSPTVVGERLKAVEGGGISKIYVTPSCTDLPAHQMQQPDGSTAGIKDLVPKLGVVFMQQVDCYNFTSPGPHVITFELDGEYLIHRVEASGCTFSYSAKHAKWQTAPSPTGPWTTLVKVKLPQSKKERTVTDLGHLDCSTRFLRVEVVDNYGFQNVPSKFFSIFQLGIYGSLAPIKAPVPEGEEGEGGEGGEEELFSDEEDEEEEMGGEEEWGGSQYQGGGGKKGRRGMGGDGGAVSFKKFKKLSPRSRYIESCANKLLLPEPMGLNHANSRRKIDLSDYGMGDAFADCLAMASLSTGLIKLIDTLILRKNKLNDRSISNLLVSITSDDCLLTKLDLSFNNITAASVQGLQEAFKKCRLLRDVNLESNSLADRGLAGICEILGENRTVRVLRLGHNRIKKEGTAALAAMLSVNTTLTHLGLDGNEVCPTALAPGLLVNSTLEVLDLSSNKLGSATAVVTVMTIGGGQMEEWHVLACALGSQRSIVHLDLSCNGLTRQECEVLGKEMERNHVCLGLHMAGNPCTVDSQGFITVTSPPELLPPTVTPSSARLTGSATGLVDAVSHARPLKVSTQNDFRLQKRAVAQGEASTSSSPPSRAAPPAEEVSPIWARILDYPHNTKPLPGCTCWLCGNWSEVKFEWRCGVSGEKARHDIVVHLEVDNFVKCPLRKSLSGDSYLLHRMLPPGQCRYFFTADGNPTPIIAKDHQVSTDVTNLEVKNFYSETLALNCVVVKPAKKTFSARNGVALVRPSQHYLAKSPIDNVWSLNSSVFGSRIVDSDTNSYWEMPPLFLVLLQDEWTKAKLEKHYRREIATLTEYRQVLSQGGFTTIFHIFRYYSLLYPANTSLTTNSTASSSTSSSSSSGITGDPTSWGTEALEHFLDDAGIRAMIDDKTLRLILGRTVLLGTKAGTATGGQQPPQSPPQQQQQPATEDPLKLTIRAAHGGFGCSGSHGLHSVPSPSSILLYQVLAFLFALCVEVRASAVSGVVAGYYTGTAVEGEFTDGEPVVQEAPAVSAILGDIFKACRFEVGDAYRNCRLYRQEVDSLLREYYGDLDRRFKKYSSGKSTMTLNQFTQMLTEERVLASRLVTAADIRVAYTMSIITKHSFYGSSGAAGGSSSWRLSFTDFLEAICRVADMLYGGYRTSFRWPEECMCSNMCGSRQGLCDACMTVYSTAWRLCILPHPHHAGPSLRTNLTRLLRQHLIFLPSEAFLLARTMANPRNGSLMKPLRLAKLLSEASKYDTAGHEGGAGGGKTPRLVA